MGKPLYLLRSEWYDYNLIASLVISHDVLGIKAGLSIDSFAPRLSFFWGIGMNFYMVRDVYSTVYYILYCEIHYVVSFSIK